MNFYQKITEAAIKDLDAALALPDIPADSLYSDGECFNPWDLFPSVYGTYSSHFDDLAIDVLTDILDGEVRRDGLAEQMFREMLCKRGFCTYGTSPRTCFAEPDFYSRLPVLIERWKAYSKIHWER